MRVLEQEAIVGYGPQSQAINSDLSSRYEGRNFSGNREESIHDLAHQLNGNSTDSRRGSLLYEFIRNEEDENITLTTPSGQPLSSIFSENCNNILSSENYTDLGALYNNLNQLNNSRRFSSDASQLASQISAELNFNFKRFEESNPFAISESEIETKLHNSTIQQSDLRSTFLENQVNELRSTSDDDGIASIEFSKQIINDEVNEASMDENCGLPQIDRNPQDNCSAETTPDDSLIEDEEASFLQSSVSSCTSISSQEKSNFPRGIINPNYPGFQHLAHTLSEHFASHQSSDPYDSDFSEYEMELSVDSFDDSIESHNNNQLGGDNNNEDDELQHADLPLDEACPDIKVIAYESDTCGDLDKESCNLETYLKKFETSADVKRQGMGDDETDEMAPRGCPTPDILIKNNTSLVRRKVPTENRPDLLRNVSPPNLKESGYDSIDSSGSHEQSDEGEVGVSAVRAGESVRSNMKMPEVCCATRDDGSLGITPVDIVGDFGREVEMEFGLLVSGYKTNSMYTDSQLNLQDDGEDISSMEKMLDAALSDGIEYISSGKLTNSQFQCDDVACDLLLDATSRGEENAKTDQPTPPSELGQSTATGPVPVTQMGPESKNKLTDATEPADSAGIAIEKTDQVDRPLPTAVVKPKYQRYSYDDRQLPPVGIDFHRQKSAWYENKENNSSSLMGDNNSQSHSEQAERSRRSHCGFDRSKRLVGHRSGSSSTSLRFGQSRRGGDDKKAETTSSVVAIVTPRKKDKSELQAAARKMSNSLCEKNNNMSSISKGKKGDGSGDNTNNNTNKNKTMQSSACFDVYNIETALPVIDLAAIEKHLKKAKEEERKRRNDREEIRRRLAMGAEDDCFSKLVNPSDRPGRKPSLQSRLQNGKNLQICFMNDASSDTESPSSDSETCPKLSKVTRSTSNMSKFSFSDETDSNPYSSRPLSVSCTNGNLRRSLSSRPSTLQLGPPISEDETDCDFFTKQARLQIEARMALAQAKDMAHMQMEIEKQKQRQSPITEVIRNSLEKVGVPLPPEKRRVSRQMLTDMNIAQLQIIVNDLHTQIEFLNNNLVQFLMERDDLHMGQDSMLVDIEDLTRYLGAKEQSVATAKAQEYSNYRTDQNMSPNDENISETRNIGNNIFLQKNPQPQSKLQRIANLVKK